MNITPVLDLQTISQFADLEYENKYVFKKSFSFAYMPDARPETASVVNFKACTNGKATFKYSLKNDDELIYESMEYSFKNEKFPTLSQWRIPPFIGNSDRLVIEINISEDTELHIASFEYANDIPTPHWDGGIRLNAHLGFWGIAPNNTMPAFELAAICGYPACIVVPKTTKDGKLVCIHDDTINKTARDKDGNQPTDPIYVWDLTLDELREYEYGSYKHRIWKGTEIPLLDDFFALCAKTGMRPMFSTHPGLSREKWLEVKAMLTGYGILEKFHIKSFETDVLKLAWEIFGTEIEGYTYDVRAKKAEEVVPLIAELDEIGFDLDKVRVGLEIPSYSVTSEKAEYIINKGYFSAAWKILNMPSDEYNRLIEMGVTEFTDDYNCSYGLNWR